jgi:ParB/RepB/Spo0J family partition protein
MMATATARENVMGFENAKFDLREVPLSKIRLGKYKLREAERNSEDYQRLRDAIAATNGPLLPIVLREIDDPENPGQMAYGLIDGLQRFSCCQDLGFSVIPARVIELEDAELAKAQIIANRSKIETKPVEYTRALHRMLNAEPTLTKEELADDLHCSVKWLNDRLSLANLHDKIGPLVDQGKIPLAHAFALVKLKPPEEQLQFVEQAQTQSIQEFSGHVGNKVKALKEAARAGRDPNRGAEFTPVPHMRPVREIKAQFEAPTAAPLVCQTVGAKTAEQGFKAAIDWVLNMDPEARKLAVQRHLDRKAKENEDKEKKKKEAIVKRAAAARAAAEKAGINLNEYNAENGQTEEDEDEDDE